MRASRRGRFHGEEEDESVWLMTFSDLVFLLLCFFVMLFSFSSLDVQKFQTLITSFQGAIGVLDGGRSLTPDESAFSSMGAMDSPAWLNVGALRQNQAAMLYDELARIIESEGLEGMVVLDVEERGIIVRFADQVLFDLGEAELKPEFRTVLERFAQALLPWDHPIRVEGHTDNLPIATTKFPSNWELSVVRATTVVRFLIEQGVKPDLLSAVGYGEYQPIANNNTPEGRAQNRRVDVVLLLTEDPAPIPDSL